MIAPKNLPHREYYIAADGRVAFRQAPPKVLAGTPVVLRFRLFSPFPRKCFPALPYLMRFSPQPLRSTSEIAELDV